MFTLLDLCVSSLRRGHANLLCIAPILTDDPRRESDMRFSVIADVCVCGSWLFMYYLLLFLLGRESLPDIGGDDKVPFLCLLLSTKAPRMRSMWPEQGRGVGRIAAQGAEENNKTDKRL